MQKGQRRSRPDVTWFFVQRSAIASQAGHATVVAGDMPVILIECLRESDGVGGRAGLRIVRIG